MNYYLTFLLAKSATPDVTVTNAVTYGGLAVMFNGSPLTFTPNAPATPPQRSSTAWYTVARTGDTFTFPQPTLVRYGYPGHYTQMTLSGAVTVNTATVGVSPAPYGPSELQAQGPAYQDLNVKIMCIGDSITGFYVPQLYVDMTALTSLRKFDFVGNGNEPPQDNNGYGGYIFHDLLLPAGTGTKFANSGGNYNGDAGDLDNWLAGQSPDIVLLHGTTNDGAINDVAGCLQAYNLILSKVRATNLLAKFIVAKIIPSEPWSTTFNAALPAWAAANTTAQSPVTLVDQYTGFNATVYNGTTNPTGMSRDGTHPTSFYAPGVGGPNDAIPQPQNLTGAYHMSQVWLSALRLYL